MLVWIFLFSTVFSLITSAIYIYSDYRRDLDRISHRMQVLETAYADDLARSLKTQDLKQLKLQMEGILVLPDIVHLGLRTGPDTEIRAGTSPGHMEILTHRFIITDKDNRERALGGLAITVSLERPYRDLWRRTGIILATQFLNTFLISVLVLWILRYFVIRHLSTMASYTGDLCLNNLSRPLVLDRPDTPANRNDELGRVTNAINRMRERLNDDLDRQIRDAAEIRKFSKAIEQSPSSVLMCDRQWRIEYANRKFSQLSGLDANSIRGKHPSALSGKMAPAQAAATSGRLSSCRYRGSEYGRGN